MAFNLIFLFDRAQALRELATKLLGLGLPPPSIAATFDFEDARAALRYLQYGEATGKVVLSLEEERTSVCTLVSRLPCAPCRSERTFWPVVQDFKVSRTVS